MAADERLAAAQDRADGGIVGGDVRLVDAVGACDFKDALAAEGGGGVVEPVPIVGGPGLEEPVAERDDPTARADADGGGVEFRGAEGEDLAFRTAVRAELVLEEAGGTFAADEVGVGVGGVGFGFLIEVAGGEEFARGIEKTAGVESAAVEADGGVPAGGRVGITDDPRSHVREVALDRDFMPFGGRCGEAENGHGMPKIPAEVGGDGLVEGDGLGQELADAPAWLEISSCDRVDQAGGDAGAAAVATIGDEERCAAPPKVPGEAGPGEPLAGDAPSGWVHAGKSGSLGSLHAGSWPLA